MCDRRDTGNADGGIGRARQAIKMQRERGARAGPRGPTCRSAPPAVEIRAKSQACSSTPSAARQQYACGAQAPTSRIPFAKHGLGVRRAVERDRNHHLLSHGRVCAEWRAVAVRGQAPLRFLYQNQIVACNPAPLKSPLLVACAKAGR